MNRLLDSFIEALKFFALLIVCLALGAAILYGIAIVVDCNLHYLGTPLAELPGRCLMVFKGQ